MRMNRAKYAYTHMEMLSVTLAVTKQLCCRSDAADARRRQVGAVPRHRARWPSSPQRVSVSSARRVNRWSAERAGPDATV